MSFNITFYKCIAENNRVDKTNYLKNSVTISGTLKENSSVFNPNILISSSNFSSQGDISNYNYMYIPKFNRYYFIHSMDIEKNGIWRIGGICDVLHTYKDKILSMNATVVRCESFGYDFIPDPEIAFENRPNFDVINFTTPFTKNLKYVLMVTGGD